MLATQMGIPLCPRSTLLVSPHDRPDYENLAVLRPDLVPGGYDTGLREILTRSAPPPDLVLGYGPGQEHVADLRLPVRAIAQRAYQRPGRSAGAPSSRRSASQAGCSGNPRRSQGIPDDFRSCMLAWHGRGRLSDQLLRLATR